MISQMKSLEDENRRLKRMFADLSMQADLLKEALGKKVTGPSQRRGMTAKAVKHRGVSITFDHCPRTNGGNGLTLPGFRCQRDVLSLQPVAQR